MKIFSLLALVKEKTQEEEEEVLISLHLEVMAEDEVKEEATIFKGQMFNKDQIL